MSTPTTGKVAFITGGNRGIGRETARELGLLGVAVILGTRDLAKGEKAVEELLALGIKADALFFDALHPPSFTSVYDWLDQHYGRLDILVNNAAIHPGDPAQNTAARISPQLLREVFETNFIAVVELTQTLLPLLRKAPSGRILNVSSVVGSLTLQSVKGSPLEEAKDLGYNASKAALNAFTVHLAHELRDTAIQVHSVDPGWVKTDMGGPSALLEISEGGKSTVHVATRPDDFPSGGFFRGAEALPW